MEVNNKDYLKFLKSKLEELKIESYDNEREIDDAIESLIKNGYINRLLSEEDIKTIKNDIIRR